MNKEIKKAWGFVKEHKKIILICSGVVILGSLGLYGVNKIKPSYRTVFGKTTFKSGMDCNKTILPNLGVGDLGDAVKYDGGTVELWLDNLTLDDIGKLGEGIINNIPNVSKDSKIWALLDIRE